MFLVVTRNFPPDIGGIQILMGGLSEALLEHGPVNVFADEFPDSKDFDGKSAANIERVKGIKFFRKYRKANLVNSFIKEHSNIRAIFFDHWKSAEVINKNYIKKTKTFCLVHAKEINHKLGSSLNKRLIESLANINFVIANSNFTKELIISMGINTDKVHIINPGIRKPLSLKSLDLEEANKIYNLSNSPDECFPKILTVARLDKRKNHDKILMTIKNLQSKFPKIKYISIGDGEEKGNLISLTNQLNLNKNVNLMDNVPEKIKFSIIASSNLFLTPSIVVKKSVEGFGISFMEAASYGVASIGGKDGGAADAIIHDKTGLICDGNNLDSIYSSVTKCLSNENYLKYGKEALKYSESFHWNKILKKYLNLIN